VATRRKPAKRRKKVKLRKKAAPRRPLAGSAAANKTETDFLLQRRINDLAAAYVSVLGELWILKDRQAVLEQVLARHGIPAPEAVEQFEPEGKFKAELDAERKAWVRRMVGALFRKGLPPVS
jgi:hypothetical protein